MGKMKDVLIEIEDLRELIDILDSDRKDLQKQLDHALEENARLAGVARKEMQSSSRMLRICRAALEGMDSQISAAYYDLDDAVCRDH